MAGDCLLPSGIAVYKNRRKAPHLLAFPIGEGGPRQRWIGCFRMQHKCALTQTTPWCFPFRLSLAHDLPVCKKDPSTSALMTCKKDGSSHIVFHATAWIHPAPLARPFSKGLLVSYITPIVPKHATYLPDESPSALAYRHPERTKLLYV